jgi:hypothetical protein
MKHTESKFAKSKYLQISELGSRFNLSFSSQLVLGNKIIALDGIKKCLLVLETDAALSQSCIIDLNKVVAVTVKKSYRSINQGELKSRDIEEFVKRIDLQFEFSNKNETIVLPFYESEIDEQRDRPKLNRNAKNWQMILSKIIGSRTGKVIKEQNRDALAQ